MAWRDRWRALLLRARAPTVYDDAAVDPLDEFPAPAASREHSPYQSLLDDIEATALAIYVAHGLPDLQGHYARNPETGAWTFIAGDLTPRERFAIVEANPPEKGWRFGRLPDLGLQSRDSLLITAGTLLDGVAKLRASAGLATQDDLLAAIGLGETWRAVRESQTFGSSRLVLTIPEDRNEAAPPD